MTTYSISGLPTAVTTPAETDAHEVNQGGVSKRETNAQILSLRGLFALAHNSANQVFASNTNAIVDFNTVDYDPLSTITTGAAWHFTAPATGYYQVSVEEGYVNPESNNWAVGESIELYLYKNGGYFQTIDSHFFETAATSSDIPYWALHGVGTVHLNAGQTCAIDFANSTAHQRHLDSLTQIAISRVA